MQEKRRRSTVVNVLTVHGIWAKEEEEGSVRIGDTRWLHSWFLHVLLYILVNIV